MSTSTEIDLDRVPDIPPYYVRICIPVDGEGIPFIDDSGGCADWLLQAALDHLSLRMGRESDEAELVLSSEDDDDE